jgi:hypothetical protein
MAGEAWAPSLSDVGRHIPTRTRDKTAPGTDTQLGTFNAHTTPTDAQAQQYIDDAVAGLIATVGEPPTTVAESPEIQTAMRTFVEYRAAADIEIAYPNRQADLVTYDRLNARAVDALATVKLVLAQAGTGLVDVVPSWAFPAPVPWGDFSPGSGTQAIAGGNPFGQ